MVKNKYKIERKYITNKNARSRNKLNGPRFLVAHETANNNTGADGHYNYFQGIKIQASAHAFIDDKKILEIIPLNEKAWHVQYNQDKRTLGLGYANDNAVGTELCRPGDFSKAYDRYVWYHAYLCKKFGLQPRKHIIAHKTLDPARRLDPQSWLEPNGVSWSKFINDVQAYYDAWESGNVSTSKPSKPATSNKKANLAVDGYWGKETTKTLQRYFKTPVDGEIWGQVRNQATEAITGGVKYGKGGSPLIKALQRKVGAKADGIFGRQTVTKLQQYLGTVPDGVISKPSLMVKTLQRKLNAGAF